MKKLILGIAAAIVTLAPISVSAQTNNKTVAVCPANTQCQANAQCQANSSCQNNGVCQADGVCKKDRSKCMKAKGQCRMLEGLNLTDAQKKAIKELDTPYCKKDKANCPANRADRMKMHKEARAKYLADLKKILTPEQYQKMLENNFTCGSRHHGKKHMRKGCHRNNQCINNSK